MKVGVIGSKSSCEVVKKSIKEIDSSVEVASYEEEQVNRSDRLIEECEQECDAVLFTGCAIESFVGRNYHFTRPHVSVEKSVVSIAGAFLQMQKSNIELDAFSIDIVEKQVIEDLLDAFDILARIIYSCPFQAGVEEEQYVEWHMKLLDEGKVNVALTSLRWVYKILQEKGYHAIYLPPTRAKVRVALEKLKNECALQEAEYAQAAVEIFQLTDYKSREENYYSSMLAKADIEKEIIKYTEGIQGAIFASGRREYIVFSNSGAVQEEFNQRKLLNLQKKVQEEKKISLNVGIGTGGTMNDAEMNARRALDFSLKNAKQEIFWIDAGQTQHGPLGKEIQLEYQLISSDPKLQEISEKTGLSTTSILKIIAIADVRKSYIFDAHQLAECLGITVRSARRIMNKIMEAGYGKVYAKKTAAAGGRPKALVEILFKI